MIKKMIVGLVLIILGVFLVFFQLNSIERIREKDKLIEVYRLSKDYSLGDMLDYDDLESIYIREEDNKGEYIGQIDNSIYYFTDYSPKNSLLLSTSISKSSPLDSYLDKEDMSIITLSFDIEEANAWNYKAYDKVDLYFVWDSLEKENILYEDVIIYRLLKSEPFKGDYSDQDSPKYLSFLVGREDSYEILSNKKYGNFEIIIN